MASKEDLEKQIKDLEAKLTEATVSRDRNKLVYYKPEKLRHYDGLSDVTEWIDDCKAAFTEGYSDIEKVSYVMNHLSGQAKRKVRLHGTKIKPDDIFTILLENFGGSQLYSAAQRSFFERVQQPRESVRDFSLSLNDLMNATQKIKKSSGDDETLRDHFIAGLRDAVLRKELRRPTTDDNSMKFMDCRKIAIQWSDDTDLNPQNSLFEPQVQKIEASSEIDALKKLINHQQSQINELLKLTKKNTQLPQVRTQTPKCFNCGNPGHFKNNCPFYSNFQAYSQPPQEQFRFAPNQNFNTHSQEHFRFPPNQNNWRPQRHFMSPPQTGLLNPRFRQPNLRFQSSQIRGRGNTIQNGTQQQAGNAHLRM